MYPRVSLDLMLSDSVVDLATERIDVAVRIDVPAKDPSLVVKVLSEHHRFVVTSHEYVAQLGAPARPQELAERDCLRFAYQPGRQRWTFRRGTVSEQVDINGRLAANNSDILREAILGGQGIALLPQWLVQHDVHAGRMLRLFTDWTINPKHEAVCVHVAYLPNRRHSRKVHAFIDFLTECAVSSVKV
jgi:DNA-binding transcriptional LysR family regulator